MTVSILVNNTPVDKYLEKHQQAQRSLEIRDAQHETVRMTTKFASLSKREKSQKASRRASTFRQKEFEIPGQLTKLSLAARLVEYGELCVEAQILAEFLRESGQKLTASELRIFLKAFGKPVEDADLNALAALPLFVIHHDPEEPAESRENFAMSLKSRLDCCDAAVPVESAGPSRLSEAPLTPRQTGELRRAAALKYLEDCFPNAVRLSSLARVDAIGTYGNAHYVAKKLAEAGLIQLQIHKSDGIIVPYSAETRPWKTRIGELYCHLVRNPQIEHELSQESEATSESVETTVKETIS